MRRSLLALAILAALSVLAATARAQIWIMSPANQTAGGHGGTHAGCSGGVIDASAGCPLPMLGS